MPTECFKLGVNFGVELTDAEYALSRLAQYAFENPGDLQLSKIVPNFQSPRLLTLLSVIVSAREKMISIVDNINICLNNDEVHELKVALEELNYAAGERSLPAFESASSVLRNIRETYRE